MLKKAFIVFLCLHMCGLSVYHVFGSETNYSEIQTKFKPFTGKILRNKVRMRAQPNLDGPIVKEMNAEELVLIDGEMNEFYVVKPPADTKAYIYRTFVLDGVIEGNHVNVRLFPETTAPTIAQMNAGDTVQGTVSTIDKKWLEVPVPAATRFYIAKEYIANIGDANFLVRLKQRHNEAAALLESARIGSQTELKKPFDQINIDTIMQKLITIVSQYSDFSAEAAQAKELINTIQTAYLNKKIEYLEKIALPANKEPEQVQLPANTSKKMAAWLPVEDALYEKWKIQQPEKSSKTEFYNVQTGSAIVLHGLLEAYPRALKNKPGDFLLTSPTTHLPKAYLYSTLVNLEEFAGREVTLKVVPRDNRQFAHPAYFVLSVE